MRRYLLLLAFAVLTVAKAAAQCVSVNTCVPPEGETLRYAAYFNWGAIWVKGGEAVFTAEQLTDRFHYTIKAYTMPKWRWIYDLNTSMEAYMNKSNLKPISYTSYTVEDKNIHHEKITYNNGKLQYTNWGANETDKKTVEVPHPECSYDLLNEVYASRNVDLSQYKVGEKIPFNVFFSSQMSTIYGEIMGYEKAKTRSGKTYDCVKCKANSIPYSIFDATKPVYVWVTNDARHIPVAVECKIKLGYIKVQLEDLKK